MNPVPFTVIWLKGAPELGVRVIVGVVAAFEFLKRRLPEKEPITIIRAKIEISNNRNNFLPFREWEIMLCFTRDCLLIDLSEVVAVIRKRMNSS